jgi:hypothetical protein
VVAGVVPPVQEEEARTGTRSGLLAISIIPGLAPGFDVLLVGVIPTWGRGFPDCGSRMRFVAFDTI